MSGSELNVLSVDKISDFYLLPIETVGQETRRVFIGPLGICAIIYYAIIYNIVHM